MATLTVTPGLMLTVTNNPGTGFALTATGPAGANCILEMTTDLSVVNGWQPLFTNGFDTGVTQFLDDTATNDVQRFYRARIGP